MKLLTIGNTAGYDTDPPIPFGSSIPRVVKAQGEAMHIPDGVLSPTTTAVTGALALAGLGLSVAKLKEKRGDRTTILMGTMAAFVFAAQMVNFPLYPFPISGHLLGGVLSAVMLGPWAGAGVIAVVLIVQCFLSGDGGLLALGANFVNMGLIGCLLGYAIYDPIRRAIGGRFGVLVGAMAAAWISVILSSAAFTIELAGSGHRSDFLNVLGWMAMVHSAIGVGEAIITGLVVRFVLQIRPDLIHDPKIEGEPTQVGHWARVALTGLAIAAAVAVFLAPFKSDHPDGLEYVGGKLQFINEENQPAPILPAPLPDYEMPGLGDSKALATAAAGLVGTLVVFGTALVLGRAFAGKDQSMMKAVADVA